ncbi:hypothetical protein BUALT_Bualt04G0143900 [Buddleja alternifolia]|uniref:EF-hand domain-containing protein n=1 Tax=Buddleja alternifolia TaxID=168488 RepID=A0AAV6XVB5_9LAMI|nr:hypothetical protein BUALT_Bualt04G0143900 [Buddleja alternifolia]
MIMGSSKNHAARKDIDSEHDKRVDHHHHLKKKTVVIGDVEIVLTSLGMFCDTDTDTDREADFPTKLDAEDVYNMFEERNPSLDEVREAFEVFDSNRDGFIDAEELKRVLCALGLKEGLEMDKCRRMIGVFDDNGDGRVDFDEFVKFMQNSFC